MQRDLHRLLVLAASLALLSGASPVRLGSAGQPDGIEFFEKKIRPLLIEKCLECHASTAAKLKGGLRLDTKDGWARGGDTGPALVPGDPEKSLLIQAVRWSNPDFQMPPKNKLAADEIAALEQWVRLGAPDPRTETPPP